MYQALLTDGSLFGQLLGLDRELALEAQAKGCLHCGERLHRAAYRRKPRGGPTDLPPEFAVRESFCCCRCRRRRTPASLRFCERKVFFSVWVLLLLVVRDGAKPERLGEVAAKHGVSVRTLYRWRRWWRELVPHDNWWRRVSGLWVVPPLPELMPCSLLAAFSGIAEVAARVIEALRCFIDPLWPRRGGAIVDGSQAHAEDAAFRP